MVSFLSLTFTLAFLASVCQGFPGGAPTGACRDLTPKHGGYASEDITNAPFAIHVGNPVNGQIDVTLTATERNRPFKGFIVNAVDSNGLVTGVFVGLPSTTAKAIACENSDDTATHGSSKAKFEEQLQWKASTTGPVKFRATFVESYSKFYANLESQVVNIN